MQYNKLGRSGLSVSRLGLGSYLTFAASVDFSIAQRCVYTAFDKGIILFDTADCYTGAEEFLGKTLKSLPREEVVLATKCYFPSADNANCRGLSRKHIFSSIDRSLQHLQMDYIDVLQCHRFDPNTPLEETLFSMAYLIAQGKILYWGVSLWEAEQIRAVCDLAEKYQLPAPISHQYAYNLLNPQAEDTIFPYGLSRGLGAMAYYPLSQGVLSGKYISDMANPSGRAACVQQRGKMKDLEVLKNAKVECFAILAKKLKVSPAQLAIAWCLRQSMVHSVLFGVTSLSQLLENLNSIEISLNDEIISEIKQIFLV